MSDEDHLSDYNPAVWWTIGELDWTPSMSMETPWTLGPDVCGVYRLVALNEGGHPRQINRACGSDETGTLYIGAGQDSNRINAVRKVFLPGYTGTGHKSVSVFRTHKQLKNEYPPKLLAITFARTKDFNKVEKRLLHLYYLKHGELSPLNFDRSRAPDETIFE